MSAENRVLAVIGGTGLYQLDLLREAERLKVDGLYGTPSGPVLRARGPDRDLLFLARHGEQHLLAPHQVNYRANIDALRQLGAQAIVAVNAVGSMLPQAPPGGLALPTQLIDYTHGRSSSFSDRDGCKVEHIDFSDPYSSSLRTRLLDCAERIGLPLHPGGTIAVTQGPRLETAAEIRRLCRDGCDLVGMTSMPEAALAREAGIDYATVAVVANWGAGFGPDEVITMADIERTLSAAMVQAQRLIAAWFQA